MRSNVTRDELMQIVQERLRSDPRAQDIESFEISGAPSDLANGTNWDVIALSMRDGAKPINPRPLIADLFPLYRLVERISREELVEHFLTRLHTRPGCQGASHVTFYAYPDQMPNWRVATFDADASEQAVREVEAELQRIYEVIE